MTKHVIINFTIPHYRSKNYLEEARSLLDTYKHFLKSNKNVSEELRLQNKLFVDYYKKLLDAKINRSKHESVRIKKSISNEKNLLYKNWLLEKTEEMF